jgi:hypothetical protein
MARFIVKQPNGLYCIFGTIADNVLMYNLTRKELRDEVVKMAIHKADRQMEEELQKALYEL